MQQETWPVNQLLATKLRIPVLASNIIERPRLYALLDGGLRHRLTLLCAPQGFGKTTLAADWLRHTSGANSSSAPHAVGWVTLSQDDDRPAIFWSYIAAALDAAVPPGAATFAALLQAAPPESARAALIPLINALSALPTPLLLVIDNYQHVKAPEIHQSLAFLIEHLPEQVRVMLLTSHDPPLPLPRWRARGSVVEIQADQLSCTLAEARAFLAAAGLHRSHGDLQRIVAHTEGWFAGLRLVGVALQQAGDGGRGADVSCAHHSMRDYLVADVVADQPAEVRAFLLRTSVLDQMSAGLCDAVLGHGTSATGASASGQMLQRLSHLNLFIVGLDSQHEWYRYRAPFREALRCLLAQEEPDLPDVLCQRASAWYQANQQIEAAIAYALRGHAWGQAATLIGCCLGEPAFQHQRAKPHQIGEWLAQLPDEVVRAQPLLALSRACRGAPSPRAQAVPVPPRARPQGSAPPDECVRVEVLSAREREVLGLIAQGSSNNQIAGALTLSLNTVKRHTSNILAKLNATNRTQAVAHARMCGLLAAERHAPYGAAIA